MKLLTALSIICLTVTTVVAIKFAVDARDKWAKCETAMWIEISDLHLEMAGHLRDDAEHQKKALMDIERRRLPACMEGLRLCRALKGDAEYKIMGIESYLNRIGGSKE